MGNSAFAVRVILAAQALILNFIVLVVSNLKIRI